MRNLCTWAFVVFGLSSSLAAASDICKDAFIKGDHSSTSNEVVENRFKPLTNIEIEAKIFELQDELYQAAPQLKNRLSQDPRYRRFLGLIFVLLDRRGIQYTISKSDSIKSLGNTDVISLVPIKKSNVEVLPRDSQLGPYSANQELQAITQPSTALNSLAFKLKQKGFDLVYYPELYIKESVLGQYSSKQKQVSVGLLDLIFGDLITGETTLHEMSHLTTDERSIFSSPLRMKLEDKQESHYQIFSYDEILAYSRPALAKILESVSSTQNISIESFIQDQIEIQSFNERMYQALLLLNTQVLGAPQKSYLTDTSLSIDFSKNRYAFFSQIGNDVTFSLDSQRTILLPLSNREVELLLKIKNSSSHNKSRKPSSAEYQLLQSVLDRISNISRFNAMLGHDIQSILSQSNRLKNSISGNVRKIHLDQLTEDQKATLQRLIRSSLNTTHNVRQLMNADGTTPIPFEYRDFRFSLPKK